MRFEVINTTGKIVMNTEYYECIPNKTTLLSMEKAGYKFKLNKKMVNRKKLGEEIEKNSKV